MSSLCNLLAAGVIALSSSAHAAILDFRQWLDANPATPNSADNEWYATTGVGGSMMAADGASWTSPGFSFSTPLFGPRTSIGSDVGAAGPASFEGFWMHPGSGVPAVLVFEPNETVPFGGVTLHWELIYNGLSGNGVNATVLATVDGDTTDLGTAYLGGTSSEQFNAFSFGSTVMLQPGDRVSIIFSDNGSYLFDHVNMNATISVPAPAPAAALGLIALVARRRRAPTAPAKSPDSPH